MANLTPFPVMQFLDNDGVPLADGKVYTYTAGGPNEVAATYSDEAGTPNTNPVILDSYGRAAIWISNDIKYYWLLTDSKDVPIWTADNIGGGVPGGDVAGPDVSTDNGLVRFDGATGKLLQNSSVILDDYGAMDLTSLTLTTPLSLSNGGTGGNTAATARTSLGIGFLGTQVAGDKGDITVNSTGSVWTIDNNAVTAAKIPDASIGASKLNGEQTGSAPIYGMLGWVVFAGVSGPYVPPIVITPSYASSNNITVTQSGDGSFSVNIDTDASTVAMAGVTKLTGYDDGVVVLSADPSGNVVSIKTVTTGFYETLPSFVSLMWVG